MIPQTPNIIKSPLCYAGDTRTIPQTTPAGTNQLSYESGFPLLTSTPIQAGGLPPDRLDFNAALNLLSTFIYYMQSGNQFVWSNQLDYNAGAFVLGSDNAVYFCIQANGATEPNTVQDPISSPDYWVQILSSDGKLNADALSVTLGAFATLNSLDLSDNKLTGVLSGSKGGLGVQLSDDDASGIFVVGSSEEKDLETVSKQGRYRAVWSNAPDSEYSGQGYLENYAWASKFGCQYFINPRGVVYKRYRGGDSFVGWKKIENPDGTTPVSAVTGLATVATSGSYNDLTNKPTIPTNVAPLPISYNIGRIKPGIWHNLVLTQSHHQLPDGGSWAYICCLRGPYDVGFFFSTGVAAGGSSINILSNNNAPCFLWRIQ